MLVQIAGSLLVLSGFVLAQLGVLNARWSAYSALYSVGSSALAAEAMLGRQWGFLLLEGVWTIVSVASMARLFRQT